LLSQLVNKVSDNVVQVHVKVSEDGGSMNASGSGLLIDKEGTILTCEHVIHPEGRDAESIDITKRKEVPKKAEIVKTDNNYDAALIRAKDLSVNENIKSRAYEQVNVGEGCFVLGYPIGLNHLTLGIGVISAKGIGLLPRFMFNLIQIDARVNDGNSGGPVFDAETGDLIGILTMKYIPFKDKITELYNTVKGIHTPIKQVDTFTGIDWGALYNKTHRALEEISQALMLVQTGIGWVIPIDTLKRELNFQSN
jgi:S1-C subfamily serine protease